MNDNSNESIFNELPDGLRQAVVASMAQVPNCEAESRIISRAKGIASPEDVAIGVDCNKNSISTRKPIWSALALVGLAATLAFVLCFPAIARVHLDGRLVPQFAETGETEWIIEADVNDSQLSKLNTHVTNSDPCDARCVFQNGPSMIHQGQLTKTQVDAAARSMQDGTSKLVIHLNQNKLATPRPCPVVIIIECGHEPVGRALIEFIQSRWVM